MKKCGSLEKKFVLSSKFVLPVVSVGCEKCNLTSRVKSTVKCDKVKSTLIQVGVKRMKVFIASYFFFKS